MTAGNAPALKDNFYGVVPLRYFIKIRSIYALLTIPQWAALILFATLILIFFIIKVFVYPEKGLHIKIPYQNPTTNSRLYVSSFPQKTTINTKSGLSPDYSQFTDSQI